MVFFKRYVYIRIFGICECVLLKKVVFVDIVENFEMKIFVGLLFGWILNLVIRVFKRDI